MIYILAKNSCKIISHWDGKTFLEFGDTLCQRFAMIRIADSGSGWKQILMPFKS